MSSRNGIATLLLDW